MKDKKDKTNKKVLKIEKEKLKLPEDLIGRESFVAHIIDLIKIANDNKNWTFAIDGEWGSGKSYVLSMIDEKLGEQKEYFVVKYNTWKNDFYQDPLIAIMYTILDEVERKSANFFKDIAKGMRAGILTVYDIIREIPVVDKIDKIAGKVVKRVKEDVFDKQKPDITKNFISYNEALEYLQKQLIKLSKKYKLVILVDELDRCEPEYALTILNRLHNLFEINNCIVLLAVNKNQLNQVIESKYGKESKDKYLEKFFDLSFELPEIGEKDIRQRYCEQFFLEFFQTEDFNKSLFVQIIQSYLTTNARNVVKFFEKLRFVFKNCEDKNKKYDMLCLSSFLLASNFDFEKFWEEREGLADPNGVFQLSNPNINHYIKKELIYYVLNKKRGDTYGNIRYQKYDDFEIVRFFALLNIVRYYDNDDIVPFINHYFGVDLKKEYLDDIRGIIDTIKVLNKRG